LVNNLIVATRTFTCCEIF